MNFSETFSKKSPFNKKIKKKSKKQAKTDYIATETANSLSTDADIDAIVSAENKAAESYKNLSWKEKRNLRKT
tara:strand:- start:96 stop:314 length:219 start_codon:yes stop_codon:yes gene_type:complete